jgi:hypothetical protein
MRCESVEKDNKRIASTVNNIKEISLTKKVVEEQLRELVGKADGCTYCIVNSYERYNSHTFEKCTRKGKWVTKEKIDKMYRNWIIKKNPSGYMPSEDNNNWSDYAEGTSQMIIEESSSTSNTHKFNDTNGGDDIKIIKPYSSIERNSLTNSDMEMTSLITTDCIPQIIVKVLMIPLEKWTVK